MPLTLMARRSRSPVPFGQIVLLVAVALIVRTWLIQGLILPCRVAGGSMAPTLLGAHRTVTCKGCGCSFTCDADVQPISPRAVCPNCGYAENDLRSRADLAGDRVLIDRSAFLLRDPRRWEIVAFRNPQDASLFAVKRVVGLPGETVRIRDGGVYVDGQIQRKSLAEQRAMAVLVHDADFTPALSVSLPPRWRADGPQSRWKAVAGRFSHTQADETDAIDWLRYCHWQRVAGQPGCVRETPVTDDCAYNQTVPRRVEDVHAVPELMLTCRLVEIAGPGELVLSAVAGGERFEMRLEPAAGRYRVLRGEKPMPSGAGSLPPLDHGVTIEVSLLDRQLLLALDGRVLAECPYDLPESESPPTPRPLAIGAKGLRVVLEHLRVYRNVYYTHPIGLDGRWGVDREVRLGPDEFFVLGDNSPISQDSRTWPSGPVLARRLLVGKAHKLTAAIAGHAGNEETARETR